MYQVDVKGMLKIKVKLFFVQSSEELLYIFWQVFIDDCVPIGEICPHPLSWGQGIKMDRKR